MQDKPPDESDAVSFGGPPRQIRNVRPDRRLGRRSHGRREHADEQAHVRDHVNDSIAPRADKEFHIPNIGCAGKADADRLACDFRS